jgi:hypothetical protein
MGGIMMSVMNNVRIVTPSAPIVTAGLVLNLDASNTASYPGSGTVWTDTVEGRVFDLYNGGTLSPVKTDPPTYNSDNGGYIQFTRSKFQWAYSTNPLPTLSSYTLEGWWNPDSVNTSSSVFNLIADRFNSRYNYALGIQPTANKFSLYHLRAGQVPRIDSTNNASTYFNTGWFHICGTYNNTTFKMNLYINGALAATEVTIATGRSPLNGGAGLHMAARNDTSGPTTVSNFLNGGIAVARIYSTDLTIEQVNQNYNAERARYGL